ncbi:MAG: UPF0175 family protein [Bacteroidetes bacterium]|nr:UPF0175 family protein [Bacteroidota bacterium]
MLTIPDDILAITKMSATELRQEVAVFLYAKHKLSFGQAQHLAGLDVLQFQALLFEREVPMHYDVADFEEDLSTLNEP